MTVKELEEAIGDLIENLYCAKYNKKMQVVETFTSDNQHLGYILKLDINKPERPFTIAMEGTDKEFLTFVCKQLRFTGLDRIDYFEGVKCPCLKETQEDEECCCQGR